MKSRIILSSLLFFGFFGSAQSDRRIQIGCDCLHKAGRVSDSDESSASLTCAGRLANIPGEEDISVHVEPENPSTSEPSYACFAIHYVYGFGESRSAAIGNARKTCSALVRSDQIEESLIRPDECKDISSP